MKERGEERRPGVRVTVSMGPVGPVAVSLSLKNEYE